MRVLLIPTFYVHVRTIPLGIAYIASYLKQSNIEVKVYDPAPYEQISLESYIDKFKPDIIGISCMTPSYSIACDMAKLIKSKFDIPIVFGGVHPTALPKETLSQDFVDFVVIGEGEYTLKELVEALALKKGFAGIKGLGYKSGKNIVINEIRPYIDDLDSLPMPERELFPLKWYFQRHMGIRGKWVRITNIMSSRGCPFSCTYCASKVVLGRKVRYHSPKRVADEIEVLIRKHKLDGLSFSDDTFTLNHEHAASVCREIRRRNLKFFWRVQMRADTVTEEIIKELASSGCIQVDMGIETGSPKVLKIIKKGIVPQQVIEAVRILKKYNMRVCTTFMLGIPGETYEDIEMTRQLAKTINTDYTQFFVTTPYPGTELFTESYKTDPKIFEGISYSDYRCGGEDLRTLLKTSIPKEEVIALQNKLNAEFLTRIPAALILKNKYFLWDMFMLILQKPSIIPRSIRAFFKSYKLLDVYRLWYKWQNLRKF